MKTALNAEREEAEREGERNREGDKKTKSTQQEEHALEIGIPQTKECYEQRTHSTAKQNA